MLRAKGYEKRVQSYNIFGKLPSFSSFLFHFQVIFLEKTVFFLSIMTPHTCFRSLQSLSLVLQPRHLVGIEVW